MKNPRPLIICRCDEFIETHNGLKCVARINKTTDITKGKTLKGKFDCLLVRNVKR